MLGAFPLYVYTHECKRLKESLFKPEFNFVTAE